MPRVWIPAPMRDLTNGVDVIEVTSTRVGDIIDELDREYPGVKDRLCEKDALRLGIALVVGTDVSREGLRQIVKPDSEIHFLPAIGGGTLR